MEKYIWEIKDFYEKNKTYCIATLIVMAACIAGIWLVHDSTRNEPVYSDTDNTVDRIEERIDRIEQRINTMQDRLEQTQKTVSGISDRVSSGREHAAEIATGIGATERRLDDAIQRSGRIQNLVAEIERSNRQREAHSQETNLAK